MMQDQERTIPSGGLVGCGEFKMGNEPGHLEGGIHWDDPRCKELGS